MAPPANPPTAADYDAVPYDSLPFAHCQPANLAALAALFGLHPSAPETARVLELGCASAGNLIPLASRFPGAQFTGIDLSARHVELASERIAAAGLTNITVRQGDLADPAVIAGTFDYIICHGVYSWVPPAVQAAIFELCARHLAPAGIAYISYNVWPGWHLRQVIRDIFQRGASAEVPLLQQVARGRALLAQLAALSSEETPYGRLLRREAGQLAAMPDSYIVGEFLSEHNAPCHFAEFVARAAAGGLAYLCETDVHVSLPHLVSPELDELLTREVGRDPAAVGAYLDLAQGRQFRQSLLVREGLAGAIKRRPEPYAIAGLNFAATLRLVADQSRGADKVLRDQAGRTITTNDPVFAQALDALGAASPETRTLDQLVGEMTGRAARDRVLASLLQAIAAGLVNITAVPLICGTAAQAKPRLWRGARADLASGQPWVTSLRHVPLRLDPLARALLPALDGRSDHAALARYLLAQIDAGALDRAVLARAPRIGSTPLMQCAGLVELVLAQLAQLALFEPAP